MAHILFPSAGGDWISLFLIIDSGARVSALPKSDARLLGIVPEAGVPVQTKGIGEGMISGWKHEMAVRFGDMDMRLPVVFLDILSSPRVLGREGVFDQFSIVFEERKRRSGFLTGKKSASVSRILDTAMKKS